MISSLVVSFFALGSCPQGAAAQVLEPTRARVTRQDFAEVVQDVDAAFTNGRRLPAAGGRSALAATNLAFDAITMTFFSLQLVRAFEELVALREELGDPDAGLFGSRAPDQKEGNGSSGGLQGATLRQALLARLEKLGEGVPEDAARALRQRLKLRWDAPSKVRSAEFLIEPVTYEASLLAEMVSLERGEDPYALRRGDHWRTFIHGRRGLATRVFFPGAAAESAMPLVVAFHGAGGDENFLFEVAGQGRIKTLAERHGALVVAPFTIDFMSSKKAFESLLAGIKADYDFDESRVFVVGHSMGAMTVAKLCQWAPERLAAAACIAGFTEQEFGPIPPIHVISGELDSIVPFAGVKSAAEAAASAGAPVRFTAMKDQGHTLLLPAALDLVFADWFPPN